MIKLLEWYLDLEATQRLCVALGSICCVLVAAIIIYRMQAPVLKWSPKPNHKIENVCWNLVKQYSHWSVRINRETIGAKTINPEKWKIKKSSTTRHSSNVLEQLFWPDDSLMYSFVNPSDGCKNQEYKMTCHFLQGKYFHLLNHQLDYDCSGSYILSDLLCSDDPFAYNPSGTICYSRY